MNYTHEDIKNIDKILLEKVKETGIINLINEYFSYDITLNQKEEKFFKVIKETLKQLKPKEYRKIKKIKNSKMFDYIRENFYIRGEEGESNEWKKCICGSSIKKYNSLMFKDSDIKIYIGSTCKEKFFFNELTKVSKLDKPTEIKDFNKNNKSLESLRKVSLYKTVETGDEIYYGIKKVSLVNTTTDKYGRKKYKFNIKDFNKKYIIEEFKLDCEETWGIRTKNYNITYNEIKNEMNIFLHQDKDYQMKTRLKNTLITFRVINDKFYFH